jgi:hypothetical protein
VEDLHWADQSTRDLLAFLVRTLRRERVLLVATYRSDEPRTDRLGPWLAELDRGRPVRRLELGRLDRAETAAQLIGILVSLSCQCDELSWWAPAMAERGRPKTPLVLTEEERQTLERWARRAKAPKPWRCAARSCWHARRARPIRRWPSNWASGPRR